MILVRVPARSLFRVKSRPCKTVTLGRALSNRASSILSALDLPTVVGSEVPGLYDGTWGGKGDVFESVCPSTGEVLARVRSVSEQQP